MTFRRDEYLVALAARGVHPCADGDCAIVRPVGMHTNGGCSCTDKLGRRFPRTDLRLRILALAEVVREEEVDVSGLACGDLCVMHFALPDGFEEHPLGPMMACRCLAPDRPLLVRFARQVAARIREHYGAES